MSHRTHVGSQFTGKGNSAAIKALLPSAENGFSIPDFLIPDRLPRVFPRIRGTKPSPLKKVEYQLRLARAGKRPVVELGFRTLSEAQRLALGFQLHLKHSGWRQAYEYLAAIDQERETTFGQVFDQYRDRGPGNLQQRKDHIANARRMLSEVVGIVPASASASNSQKALRRNSVDIVRLKDVDEKMFADWQERCDNGDYLAESSGKVRSLATADKRLRSYRTIFGPRARRKVKYAGVPDTVPGQLLTYFDEAPRCVRQYARAAALIEKAQATLLPLSEQAYRMLLLCLLFGLRRCEATGIRWKAFDLEQMELVVDLSTVDELKTKSSVGKLPLSPGVAELFGSMRAGADGNNYVVESRSAAVGGSSGSDAYRARDVTAILMGWLSREMPTIEKPIQELRRIAGWEVYKKSRSIYEASLFLRHSNVSVTERWYMQRSVSTVVDLPSAALGGQAVKPSEDGKLVPFRISG